MVFWPPYSYPWYIKPHSMVYRPTYPWYFDPLIHGISTPLSMVNWPPTHIILSPLSMVYRPLYPWYFDPLTHDILTPYSWYINPLAMVFWLPYPWYIDPPTHGISTPLTLPMVFWPPLHGMLAPLSMGGGEGGAKYHWGSIYHTGGGGHDQFSIRRFNIPWMKNDPGVIFPWGSKYHMTLA